MSKKIISRITGNQLTSEEALTLCARVKRETGAVYVENVSTYGYSTPELAKEATLEDSIKLYTGYTFAFAGAIKRSDGYRACVIAIKDIPVNFEKLFPDYVVIG